MSTPYHQLLSANDFRNYAIWFIFKLALDALPLSCHGGKRWGSKRYNNHLFRRFIMVSCALIAMGLLVGFHSILHASISFVWLHGIANMAGGILFSAI